FAARGPARTRTAAPAAAQNLREDIVGGKSARLFLSALAPAEMKFTVATAARAAAERIAAKTALLRIGTRIEAARVALGVDFAGVEFGALVLVADHVIGRGDFLEALLGFFIAGMGVGMVLLGERAEGLLDFGFAGGLGDAKCFIRIVHSNSNLRAGINIGILWGCVRTQLPLRCEASGRGRCCSTASAVRRPRFARCGARFSGSPCSPRKPKPRTEGVSIKNQGWPARKLGCGAGFGTSPGLSAGVFPATVSLRASWSSRSCASFMP